MGFKLRSGNSALAFKSMGSSPAKQEAFLPKGEYMPVSDKTKQQIADDKALIQKLSSKGPNTGLTPEIINVRGKIEFDPHTDRILEKSLKPRIVDGKKFAPSPEDIKLANKYQKLTTKRKGRKSTILTSVTGLEGSPTLSKKSLLG